MNKTVFLSVLCLAACAGSDKEGAKELSGGTRTEVTVTHPAVGKFTTFIEFPATSKFLRKWVVTAPVAAFVAESYIHEGSRVRNGDVLYSLESREQRALSSRRAQSISITAESDGIITAVMQQSGGFVAEGTTLCEISDENSLVFCLNIPPEQGKIARTGKKCVVILPDGRRCDGIVRDMLGTMDNVSQSLRVIVQTRTPFLPEGLNASVLFCEESNVAKGTSFILPASCVMSDEQMHEHWVMKLTADSTAVRTAVQVGACAGDSMEISSDALKTSDFILLTGGYALPDGAHVRVSNK